MSTTTKKKTEDFTVPDFDNNKTYTQQNYELTDYLFNKAYNDFGQRFKEANDAAVALQRQQQQQSEDAFYRNLYDTNQTVLDTIRKNNASAIASGASKGTQAANELAAMLGMQQESVDSATQLAQQGYDLAAQQQQSALQASVDAAEAASGLTSNLASALGVSQQADAVRYQTEFETNLVAELAQKVATDPQDTVSLALLKFLVPENYQDIIEGLKGSQALSTQVTNTKQAFGLQNTPAELTEKQTIRLPIDLSGTSQQFVKEIGGDLDPNVLSTDIQNELSNNAKHGSLYVIQDADNNYLLTIYDSNTKKLKILEEVEGGNKITNLGRDLVKRNQGVLKISNDAIKNIKGTFTFR